MCRAGNFQFRKNDKLVWLREIGGSESADCHGPQSPGAQPAGIDGWKPESGTWFRPACQGEDG
jgi:hypothetical protein